LSFCHTGNLNESIETATICHVLLGWSHSVVDALQTVDLLSFFAEEILYCFFT
jgi:hypothetical protein